jgi:hypothetical protein
MPTLGATGPFRPGESMVVTLRGVPSGAPGLLSIAGPQPGFKALPYPERFFPTLPFMTHGPAEPGAGRWSQVLPIPPTFAGLRHRLRVEVIDPAHPSAPMHSNVLELKFGR